MENKPVLVAEHISKSYIGVQALDDINITINRGEVKCLAGENGSGKSTFVKIIAGVEAPDSGSVTVDGVKYTKFTPITAINAGVQVIYQDLSLFDNMTVAENIALNKLIKEKKSLVNKEEVRGIAKQQLNNIGVSMDINAKVQTISIANRQIVAICRALALDAKILFMDEPTTALTRTEVDRLLSIVETLREQGLAIVFISHKLDEVMSIADSITVFRDGKQVADMSKEEVDKAKLVYYMTGRDVRYTRYHRGDKDDKVLLDIKDLSKGGHYSNINLDVRPSDIMGLTGLLGSGRTELALSIFGLNPPDSGEILFDGRKLKVKNPVDAVKHGIALLPEERATQGLLLDKDLTDNVSTVVFNKVTGQLGILIERLRAQLADTSIDAFKIKIPNRQTKIKTLSGGNQQKVVLGKWVAAEPKLFILDSPTVGVDIGSKAEIYEKIQQLANEGMAIILISDEVEEIVSNCNRVCVMYNGEIIKRFGDEEMKDEKAEENIMDVINNLYKINKSGGDKTA